MNINFFIVLLALALVGCAPEPKAPVRVKTYSITLFSQTGEPIKTWDHCYRILSHKKYITFYRAGKYFEITTVGERWAWAVEGE